MVTGVVNYTGIGEYQSRCTSFGAVKGINITLIVSLTAGEATFIIIEPVTADTHTVPGQGAALPAIPVFCLIFRNEVIGQSAVQMDLQCHILLCGTASVAV